MLYLSAQPDNFYFLWQLKLQLYNFNKLGILPEQIHVLIGYEKQKGLASCFKQFIKENKQAKFYPYPDCRKKKKYLSSLRPHIIAQHVKQFPVLQQAHIFYHDSDIIFNRLPNFAQLNQNDAWYASATGSYTNIAYIERMASNDVFLAMCKLTNIKPATIQANDHNMGGAQYLLKNVPLKFWQKLETDCEKVFTFLSKHVNKQRKTDTKTNQIQAWCTDMWCLWWQAMATAKVAIHDELDFAWADTPLEINKKKSILHYTGKVPIENETLFRKGNYVSCPPFYDDFSIINKNTASFRVVEEIINYNYHKLSSRAKYKQLTIVIPVNTKDEKEWFNIYTTIKYLNATINCNVIVVLNNKAQHKFSKLPAEQCSGLIYKECYDGNFIENLSLTIGKIKTAYTALYSPQIITDTNSIGKILQMLKQYKMVIAQEHLKVDVLMHAMFNKNLDINFLKQNAGKLTRSKSNNKCVFFASKNNNVSEVLGVFYNEETTQLFTQNNIVGFTSGLTFQL